MILAINLIISMTQNNDYDALYRDAVHISSSLMIQGIPTNWTINNVVMPGLISENTTAKLSFNKLNLYDQLTYARTKTLLHTTHEYIFFFRNSTTILNYTSCVRGYPIVVKSDCSPDLSSIKYTDLVKIDRIVASNASLALMTVYVWDS